MKQRQRLRMQGHDVKMCKNVTKTYLEGSAFITTDNEKRQNRQLTSPLLLQSRKEE